MGLLLAAPTSNHGVFTSFIYVSAAACISAIMIWVHVGARSVKGQRSWGDAASGPETNHQVLASTLILFR